MDPSAYLAQCCEVTVDNEEEPTVYTVSANHTYEVTETVAATYSSTGSITYTCSECGDTYTETIAKLVNTASSTGSSTTDTTDTTTSEVVTENADSAAETTTTTTPTEVTVTESTVVATISEANGTEVVAQAAANESEEIVVSVDTSSAEEATTVQAELDVTLVESIVENTSAALTIATEDAQVTLDQTALASAVSQATGSTITVEIENVANPEETIVALLGDDAKVAEISVISDGEKISTFDGGTITIRLTIPTSLQDKKVAAVYVESVTSYSKVSGKTVTIDGVAYYEFKTNHLSTYALVDGEALGVTDEDAIIEGVQNTTIKLSSKLVTTKSGKTAIKLSWTKSLGYKVDYYEVFRSTKRYSGYTKKAFYTKEVSSISATYTNTKSLKTGTTYYYKVRGVREIDGVKYYTQWSNKAYRTVK